MLVYVACGTAVSSAAFFSVEFCVFSVMLLTVWKAINVDLRLPSEPTGHFYILWVKRRLPVLLLVLFVD